jgi:uncharacterized protein YhbP (UPF0306 family)
MKTFVCEQQKEVNDKNAILFFDDTKNLFISVERENDRVEKMYGENNHTYLHCFSQ